MTRQLLGLPLPDQTLRIWAKHFVFALEPLFLPFELAKYFPVVLSRAEFLGWLRSQPLEYADAYQPWQASGEWVVLTKRIPSSLMNDVNATQVQANRGLVFSLEVAQRFAMPEKFLERDAFENWFLLRLDAWRALSPEKQFEWLCLYVSEDALTSSHLSSQQKLVGWEKRSGMNCFSTALLGHVPMWKAHIPNWLQSQTLVRLLEQRGYTLQPMHNKLEAQDVLVWKNGETIVHACTFLGHGMVLNKDSQSWASPRQILPLEMVLERWQEPYLEVLVLTK